jgi:4-amino-4-deoxy-L-arabinose transferase-like glycosyltransferase
MLRPTAGESRFQAVPIIRGVPRWCIWAILVMLAGAAFLHLDADFPNHSRWIDDGAKFTDEGWYASGAINHVLTGHWLRSGDFNPVVTIPVWPLLLDLFVHFTAIHVSVARGLAFAFTIGSVLVCGVLMAREHRPLAPILMLLVGTSPVLYFFSRLALLEPMLIFFVVCTAAAAFAPRPPGVVRSLGCGVLFALAMLAKSSAFFVAPAILYLLWFPHRSLWGSKGSADAGARRVALMAVILPVLTATGCYGLYWLLVIHAHPADLKVLYQENTLRLDRRSAEKAFRVIYRCFTWVDMILFPIAVAAVVLSVRKLRELWQDPLFGFAVLFFLGYSAFMVLHFDAAPHYFDVLVVPVMIVVVLLLNALELRMPLMGRVAGGLVVVAVVLNIGCIVRQLAAPEHTFRDACMSIRSRIESDPEASPLVIGHGAVETTLFTGIPALDDLGSMALEQKIGVYRPGWAVLWSDSLGILRQPAVASRYSFTEVGKYSVFDNPRRRFLYLYRIRAR